MSVAPFTWRDGERVVRFGRGALASAPDLIGGEPYVLLTTARAAAAAPLIATGAAAVHEVPPGRVDEVSAGLRGAVRGPLLVALGGGRVIDVAKALAAADPPRRVAAVPTTLSAAEMTATHRLPIGAEGAARVRPAVVVNDPALSASQPGPSLAASAANALGHAAEAPLTPRANPVATLAAGRAAELLMGGFEGAEPDRDALALGALLAGYAMDSTGYGLHHVLSQTLARHAGVGHGPANAAMLPHAARALAQRFPGAAGLEAIGAGAARLAQRAGAARLRDLGLSREDLPALAAAAAERPELANTPPAASAEELRRLYEAAW
ncbi:MAG TPA: iron-containing alcohol dehydrogenase [Miltoncostaeaceae bacterium]|nr:iron-containing alcohol dehydrogenase [Miltoncostaeaceae bacterium]